MFENQSFNNSMSSETIAMHHQRRSPTTSSAPFPLRDLTASAQQAENRRGSMGGKMSPSMMMPPHNGGNGSMPVSPLMQSAPTLQQLAVLQAAAFAAAATMSSLSQGLSPMMAPQPQQAFPGAPLHQAMLAGIPMSPSFASMSRLDGVSPTNSEYRRIRQNDPYAASVLPVAFEDQQSRAESACVTAGNSPTMPHPIPAPWDMVAHQQQHQQQQEQHQAAAASRAQLASSQQTPKQPRESKSSKQSSAPAAAASVDVPCQSEFIKTYLNGRPTVSPKTSPLKTQPESTPVTEAPSAAPSAAATAAAVASAAPSTRVHKWLAVVAFRYRTLVYSVECLAPIAAIGNYVIVDGDRGEDMGKILRVADVDATPTMAPTELFVRRLATQQEVNRWASLVREETSALENVRRRSREILGEIPGFSILGVEYQFDKLKLFIYYVCEDRVYFVPLLKALNAMYHCRIWMETATPQPQAHHHTALVANTTGASSSGNSPSSIVIGSPSVDVLLAQQGSPVAASSSSSARRASNRGAAKTQQQQQQQQAAAGADLS